jgi:hypothetical protein
MVNKWDSKYFTLRLQDIDKLVAEQQIANRGWGINMEELYKVSREVRTENIPDQERKLIIINYLNCLAEMDSGDHQNIDIIREVIATCEFLMAKQIDFISLLIKFEYPVPNNAAGQSLIVSYWNSKRWSLFNFLTSFQNHYKETCCLVDVLEVMISFIDASIGSDIVNINILSTVLSLSRMTNWDTARFRTLITVRIQGRTLCKVLTKYIQEAQKKSSDHPLIDALISQTLILYFINFKEINETTKAENELFVPELVEMVEFCEAILGKYVFYSNISIAIHYFTKTFKKSLMSGLSSHDAEKIKLLKELLIAVESK